MALWRPPPRRIGQAALVLATLFTGALLALFGQSYQTGADVHELFFTWALLALPFALAGLSGAVWAVWWSVLNVGLALLCGWLGLDHVFWRVIDGRGFGHATLLMLPCLANLLGAGLFLMLRGTRLRRGRAACGCCACWRRFGLGYGTAATLPSYGLSAQRHGRAGAVRRRCCSASHCSRAIAWCLAAQRDVFPLTVLAGSWIAISTAWLAHAMRLNDLGELFVIAMWLIASSTLAGMLLMRWLRQWRAAATEGVTS